MACSIQEGKKNVWRKAMWMKPLCNCTWAFSSKNDAQFLFTFFSSFLRKNFLVGSERKHLDPTIYFSSSSPNQTHSKKFSSHFLSKVFHYWSLKFTLCAQLILQVSSKRNWSLKFLEWAILVILLISVCSIAYVTNRIMTCHFF